MRKKRKPHHKRSVLPPVGTLGNSTPAVRTIVMWASWSWNLFGFKLLLSSLLAHTPLEHAIVPKLVSISICIPLPLYWLAIGASTSARLPSMFLNWHSRANGSDHVQINLTGNNARSRSTGIVHSTRIRNDGAPGINDE